MITVVLMSVLRHILKRFRLWVHNLYWNLLGIGWMATLTRKSQIIRWHSWVYTEFSPLQWRHNECDLRWQINENSKVPRHWPLWPNKGPVTRKMFQFDDVIMSWSTIYRKFISFYKEFSVYLYSMVTIVPFSLRVTRCAWVIVAIRCDLSTVYVYMHVISYQLHVAQKLSRFKQYEITFRKIATFFTLEKLIEIILTQQFL